MIVKLSGNRGQKIELGATGEAHAWYNPRTKRWQMDLALSSDKGYVSVTFGPDSRNSRDKMAALIAACKDHGKRLLDLAESVEQANADVLVSPVKKSIPEPKDTDDFL